MYQDDHGFNFYNSENQGYQGGFGEYHDANQAQQPGSPSPAGSGSGLGRRGIALLLACALVGGAAGAGGAALYHNLSGSGTTVVYKSERPADTVSTPASGQLMTAQELYAANVASCVGITVSTTTTNIFGYTSTAAASGSGFVLSENGYIVTNYHVVEDAARSTEVSITVAFQNGQSYTAELVGAEQSNDVAVLKIDASGLKPVVLGDSDRLAVGQGVMAIGNPLGELTYSLTDGLISALDRLITTSMGTMNMFQTNCVINSGNSGGPVFNSYGEVVGIATAKYGGDSSTGAIVEGLGFAIPINDVKNILSDLVQYGYVTGKPYMGIQMQSVPQNAQMYGVSAGAYVTGVASGSAAEKAGLKQGDIIVAVDDTVVDSASALSAAVSAYRAGDEAKLTIIRSHEKMELTIVFDEENEQTVSANQLPQEQTQQSQQQNPQNQNPQGGYQYYWPFGNFFF